MLCSRGVRPDAVRRPAASGRTDLTTAQAGAAVETRVETIAWPRWARWAKNALAMADCSRPPTSCRVRDAGEEHDGEREQPGE